jgi:P-type conjugative transfer protein TrbJ
MRLLLVALLLALLLLPVAVPPLQAQFIVLDPANLYEQIIQYIQMLLDYYQQYEILANQVEQLFQLVDQVEMMLQNLEQLEEVWADNPGRALADLRSLMYRLGGIVYGADDLLWRYDDLYTPRVPPDLPAQESEQLSETLTTFRTLLAAAQASGRDGEGAAAQLTRLTAQLEAAEGNLQALQAVGALTTEVASETTRLAEVNAMTLNTLTVYYSHELSARETARLTFMDWIDRGANYQGSSAQTFDPIPSSYPRD